MTKEHATPLQFDMFSGELVDNRTRQQKKRDKEREKPQQTEMFSAREVGQIGVTARPLIHVSPETKLTLYREDPRTEAEVEADRQRAAEEQTYRMFDDSEDIHEPDTTTLALVVRGVVALMVIEPTQTTGSTAAPPLQAHHP